MKTSLALCAALLLLSPAPALTGPSESVVDDETAEELYGDPELVPVRIEAAVARAKQENKRVLIQWGGEWCSWCHLLQKAWTENRELSHKLLYEYEVVHANIGRWDRNMELASSLGADLKENGVPFLTILGGDGKPIANQETGGFEREDQGDGLRHDPAKLLAFLTEHQAEYRKAADIVEEGLAAAKTANKRLLLTFGAPWCGWCHRFEDWMALPTVAPVLAKDFVIAKVDTDRTIGGQELLDGTRKGRGGGIPWFVFLDAEGAELATSNGPDGGNLGCPWTDAEKAAFVDLLGKVKRTISDEEVAAIVSLLGPQEEEGEGEGESARSSGRDH